MPPRESFSDEVQDNQNKINNENVMSASEARSNAEEMALLAEERWLIENLQIIRQQRNALKVEALYYQGLKATMFANHAAEFGVTPVESEELSADEEDSVPIPELTYQDQEMANPVASGQSSNHTDVIKRVQQLSSEAVPSNIDDFNILEGQCNNQELQHLSVATEKLEGWEVEDPEYESEEEEWDLNLEMGMLVGDHEGD